MISFKIEKTKGDRFNKTIFGGEKLGTLKKGTYCFSTIDSQGWRTSTDLNTAISELESTLKQLKRTKNFKTPGGIALNLGAIGLVGLGVWYLKKQKFVEKDDKGVYHIGFKNKDDQSNGTSTTTEREKEDKAIDYATP